MEEHDRTPEEQERLDRRNLRQQERRRFGSRPNEDRRNFGYKTQQVGFGLSAEEVETMEEVLGLLRQRNQALKREEGTRDTGLTSYVSGLITDFTVKLFRLPPDAGAALLQHVIDWQPPAKVMKNYTIKLPSRIRFKELVAGRVPLAKIVRWLLMADAPMVRALPPIPLYLPSHIKKSDPSPESTIRPAWVNKS